MDHATGLVIGETASVGDGCSIFHDVTLGATGSQTGDRHPKVGKNICNYNRYNRGSNLQALFTIFGITLLLFLFT